MENKKASDTLIFCLGILLIAILIQILGVAKGDSLVFPSVIEILRSFFHLLCIPKTYNLIFTTLFHLFVSLIASSLI